MKWKFLLKRKIKFSNGKRKNFYEVTRDDVNDEKVFEIYNEITEIYEELKNVRLFSSRK